jgi:hypothetical protein
LEALLPGAVEFEDHQLSHSLYSSDPGGNPFETMTYEVNKQEPGRGLGLRQL